MKKPENLLTIPGIKSFCLGIVVSAALFLPSQASADDISLNLKNVTVKRAIAALQQSHYSLTVDASQIDMERRITVAAEDEPIENVLAQIFAGQDVSYEINGRSIVVTRRAVPRVAEKAVSRTLSGVVRDDKGATIVGATVVVKGTTTGVTTDIDGRYSLRVSADDPVLQISFVGYRTAEVAVAPAQTVVDVTLAASSIDVDEVVVVGYGTQSRHTLTTAVSKIAGSAVAAAPVTSVGDALKGKVAGMQVSTTNSLPGEAPTFLIRGGSSINQSNAPIVIVTGSVMLRQPAGTASPSPRKRVVWIEPSPLPVPAAVADVSTDAPLYDSAIAGRTNDRNSSAFMKSHLREGDSQPICPSKTISGPLPTVPFLVVIRITPFDAREP